MLPPRFFLYCLLVSVLTFLFKISFLLLLFYFLEFFSFFFSFPLGQILSVLHHCDFRVSQEDSIWIYANLKLTVSLRERPDFRYKAGLYGYHTSRLEAHEWAQQLFV